MRYLVSKSPVNYVTNSLSNALEFAALNLGLELEIVTEEEAQARSADKARGDPNENPTLQPPKFGFHLLKDR
ncbi:unnamed protein product, partial [Didymodactylos carnosus]